MKVTQKMINVFAVAWHAADHQGTHVPGARRGAGLEAVMAMPEMEALEAFARAAAAHATTEGTDEWNHMIEVWDALPESVAKFLLEPR
jgi:hypothetical protein